MVETAFFGHTAVILGPSQVIREVSARSLETLVFSFGVSFEFPHTALDPAFGGFKVLETLFVAAKSRRVVIAAAVVMNSRVLYVQHFVEEHCVDHIRRHVARI